MMTIEMITTNHHPIDQFHSIEILSLEEEENETYSKARTVAGNIDECR